MSEQVECSNPNVVLYREPHSEAFGSFDDKLFLAPPHGIGIEVGGTVFVKPLKEWHELESTLTLAKHENERQAKEIAVLRDALEAVDIYFKALCEQWAANDGRVISESGVIIDASKDVERLCNIAGMKVAQALSAGCEPGCDEKAGELPNK